jgi:hypothetical protein
LQYNAHSWLMLIDARDTYFQTNPFAKLPRRHHKRNQHDTDNKFGSGLLYMFGENTNATRLGKSKKNFNWISRGYGQEVMNALDDKPTICSGSTMGEQVAVETYLRALINEHDEGQVKMAGSDQGFHNVCLLLLLLVSSLCRLLHRFVGLLVPFAVLVLQSKTDRG